MAGYWNILKPWWPTSRPAHRKRVILITCRLQEKQRRKTPADNTTKSRAISFFPLWKLKGTQPALKTPVVCLAHLEEESAKKDKEVESEDPNSLNGVTEEFMVCLARAVKDAQVEEKHCYHCSSLEHFICDCPLVKASGGIMHLNCREGMAPKKGVWTPQKKVTMPKIPQEEAPKALAQCTQTPFLNPDPFQHWYGVKNVAKVKINGESCMALLNNGAQIYTIMPSYVKKSHSLEMGYNYQPDRQRSHLHRSGKCLHLTPRLCYCQGSSRWIPGLQWRPNSPGSPTFIKFCRKDPHYLKDSYYKLHHKCHEREGDRHLGDALGECQGGPSLVSMKGCSHNSRQPSHKRAWLRWVWWGGHHKEYGDCGCFFLLHYTCEGGEGLHGGVH